MSVSISTTELMIASVGDVVRLPIPLLVFTGYFFLLMLKQRAVPPDPRIEAPPRFDVSRGVRHWARGQRFTVVRWVDLLWSTLPGALGLRYRMPRVALQHLVVGGGAALIAFALPEGSLLQVAVLLVYLASAGGALRDTHMAATDRSAYRSMGNIDVAMAAADARLQSCPRCRREDREEAGWCRACLVALAPHRIGDDDPRRRAASWVQRADDPSLASLVEDTIRISRHGVMTIEGVGCATADWRASYAARGVEGSEVVEEAFVDPARPELVWVRVWETWYYPQHGTYSASGVQACGFVDGRLAQIWVFAPLSSTALGDCGALPERVLAPSTAG